MDEAGCGKCTKKWKNEPYTKWLKKIRILSLTSSYLNVSIEYTQLQKGDGTVLEVEYLILEYTSDSRRE